MNVKTSQINMQGNAKLDMQKTPQEPTFEYEQKLGVERLFQRTRSEASSEGTFKKIVEEFKNPNTNETYMIFISPSPDKDEPKERILEVGYQIPDSPNMVSMVLKRGTKQELLDFLGNEKNLTLISGYFNMLSED